MASTGIEPQVVYVENHTGNYAAFEIIFSPGVENAKMPNLTPKKANENLNKEQLDEKMKKVEKRRKSFEGELLAKAAIKQARIKQAKAIKKRTAEEQSRMVGEKLKQKMELHIEKKEAQIQALIDRLHAKDQHILEVQSKLQVIIEANAKKAEEKIQLKEAAIKENLELQRQAQIERCQAKEKRIKEVWATLQDSIEKQSKQVELNLQQKMSTTEEKRQSQIRALQERLHIKSQRIEQARQFVDMLIQEQKKVSEEKMKKKHEQMEENRKAKLKARQEKLGAHDKHVEEVCQLVKTRRAEKAQG